MVILHSKQFIFVKTIKTAGTSIEAALSTYRQPEDVFTVINKEIQGHKPQNYRGLYFPYKDFLDMFARYHRAWLKSVYELFLLIKYWNHAGTDYHAVFRQDYMRYNERIKSLFKEEIDLFGYELR